MDTFVNGMASLISDRRRTPRFRLACDARLDLPSGTRKGTMSDLSEMGARLTVENPPPKGTSARLAWNGHEAWCKVMWVIPDGCGLEFDRPIPRAVVLETTGQDEDAEAGPIADFNRIPIGQKRSRPGLRAVG